MFLLSKRILPTLAVLVVACAQVFGLERGFVCDCGGVQEVTRADHCHGPHSAACHEDEEEVPCHDADDHQDGDSHEHPALIESLLASIASGVHFAAPAPVFVALVMPEWQMPVITAVLNAPVSELSARSEHDTRRTWPHVLAHTMVLRI